MLQDKTVAETTVDAKTAEQALALALRLQQERGERVSMDELQRTADEAGIDRVSLQRALDHVTAQANAGQAEPARWRFNRVPALFVAGIALIVLSRTFPFGDEFARLMRFVGVVGILVASASFIRCFLRQDRA